MLIILPILILILGGGSIILIRMIHPGFRFSWVIIAGVCVTVWLFYLICPISQFGNLESQNWLPFSNLVFPLMFRLDQNAWQVAFLMTALLLGGVISSVIDIPNSSVEKMWPTGLFITALGLLAVCSADPISLVIIWTVLDVLEIIIAIKNSSIKEPITVSPIKLASHFVSTLLIIWIFIINFNGRKIPGFEIATPEIGMIVILAVFLRMLNIRRGSSQNRNNDLQGAHQTIQLFVSSTAGLCLLLKIPVWPSFDRFIPLLTILFVVHAFINIFRFHRTTEGQNQKQSLINVFFTSLALSIVFGNAATITGWIGLFLAIGGLIFLFSARSKGVIWIGVLICLVFAGLPFTPFTRIWSGFTGFNVYVLLLILIHGFTLTGVVKKVLKTNEGLSQKENWVRVIYTFGLLLLLISAILIWLKIPPRPLDEGFWQGGLLAAGIGVLTTIIGWLIAKYFKRTIARLRSNAVYQRVLTGLRKTIRFTWLTRILNGIFQLFQAITKMFSNILESDGGLFWSLLLLVLIVTLLKIGGK